MDSPLDDFSLIHLQYPNILQSEKPLGIPIKALKVGDEVTIQLVGGEHHTFRIGGHTSEVEIRFPQEGDGIYRESLALVQLGEDEEYYLLKGVGQNRGFLIEGEEIMLEEIKTKHLIFMGKLIGYSVKRVINGQEYKIINWVNHPTYEKPIPGSENFETVKQIFDSVFNIMGRENIISPILGNYSITRNGITLTLRIFASEKHNSPIIEYKDLLTGRMITLGTYRQPGANKRPYETYVCTSTHEPSTEEGILRKIKYYLSTYGRLEGSIKVEDAELKVFNGIVLTKKDDEFTLWPLNSKFSIEYVSGGILLCYSQMDENFVEFTSDLFIPDLKFILTEIKDFLTNYEQSEE